MVVRFIFLILLTGLLNKPSLEASSSNPQDMIDIINDQLKTVDNPKEKAKLHCYKARNYAKAGDNEKAIKDYLTALNSSYEGWILNELGYFMYKSGEFEKAYNVADRVVKDFPQFKTEATKLKTSAKKKWDEKYLKEHPPTITMDNAPNPNRVTRHDLAKPQNTGTRTKSNSSSAGSEYWRNHPRGKYLPETKKRNLDF